MTFQVVPAQTVYRRASDPFRVGQKRQRVWRAVIAPRTASDDPRWAERAQAYWDLQGRTYGVVFGKPRVAIDNVQGLVMTEAHVLQVLPGERL